MLTSSPTQHGVHTDGTTWSTTYIGPGGINSPHWTRTTYDFLGRPYLSERPGATVVGSGNNGAETARTYFDTRGRPVRMTSTGQADVLFAYDTTTLELRRTGLDLNGNGTLDLASLDRIIETEDTYIFDGNWYAESVKRTYPNDNDATAVTLSRTLVRLTGLGDVNPNAEIIITDIHGNETRTQSFIDRATKTVTTKTLTPVSPLEAVTITVNGLQYESSDVTGVTNRFLYDALRRPIGTIDPRTGTATILYNGNNQVTASIDAAGFTNTVAYNAYGEVESSTDPNGLTTRFQHNLRGQVTERWGGGVYPTVNIYDAYGRQIELHTFRDTNTFWYGAYPTAPGAPDITRWHFDYATGVLTNKVYADGKGPTYTYGPGLRLATRTWARTDTNGNALVTTYGYDSGTGDLTFIDYSDDATPDVTHAYGRFGQRVRTTDGSGTTDYGYSTALQLISETFTRPGYASRTLHRDRETTGSGQVRGRAAGIRLAGGPHAYHMDYGYDTYGRASTFHSHHGETPLTATYSYVENSHLLAGLDHGTGLQSIYTYEPHRNVRTAVSNLVPSAGRNISTYEYSYDAGGRRTAVRNTGEAFAQAAFNLFDYNERNEVIQSLRHLGTDTANTNTPVTAEHRDYNYDPIGNRTHAIAALTNLTTYLSNELNQYASISNSSANTVSTPVHDADGNTTHDDRFAHEWNGQNRLIRSTPLVLTNGAKMVESDYDSTGRRWRKRVSTYNSGTWALSDTRIFWYDSWNIIEEHIVSTNTETVHYDWGLDLTGTHQGAGGVGGLLRRHGCTSSSTNTLRYLYEANGNVGQLADTTGTIAATFEYDPFGELVQAEGYAAQANLFRFSSKYFDAETGLYSYGHRYLDPDVGRWMSRDPIGVAGGLNVYALLGNQAVNQIDYLGMTMVNLLEDLVRLAKNPLDTFPELRKLRRNQLKKVSGVLLSLAQIGLDIGGIFEPTPFCDLASVAISCCRRQWIGAALSGLGIIPYVGDIGKGFKIGRYFDTIKNAAKLAADIPGAKPAIKNMLGMLSEILALAEKAPIDKLPCKVVRDAAEKAQQQVSKLKNQIDELTAPKGAGAADDIQYAFRGDTRSPAEIFENGFQPHGTSDDLFLHALDNTAPPSAFVPTSRSPGVAADFATDFGSRPGNVYTVKPTGGVDVNRALGSRSPYPNELEIAVPGGVSPNNIRGVTPLNPDGSFQGFSILNPNFKP